MVSAKSNMIQVTVQQKYVQGREIVCSMDRFILHGVCVCVNRVRGRFTKVRGEWLKKE